MVYLAISFSEYLFFLPQAFLLIHLISLSLELPVFWQLPSCFRDSSYILTDFWMLSMLVTMFEAKFTLIMYMA